MERSGGWSILFFMLTVNLSHGQPLPNPEARVDALLRPYQGNVPGAAVMVIHKNQIAFLKTYGMADVTGGCPVTAQTNFRLASITKQFTAMSIMILKERGKLDYSTTLTEIFPDFPAYGKKITIRHLLQHTSGLIDYEDLIPDTTTRQVLDRDVLSMMQALDSTYFPPGSAFRYSNSGYAVLAQVVERLSGKSFATFLRDEIFSPLRMSNTVAYEKGISEVPERAWGYHLNGDSITFSDQSLTSAVLGDGGIYSSVADLYHWDQMLYNRKLVSRRTLRTAFTPGLENYGFGWYCDKFQGRCRLYHTGSTCGFRNTLMRLPEAKLTVIILTNRREPDVLGLAEQIAAIFL